MNRGFFSKLNIKAADSEERWQTNTPSAIKGLVIDKNSSRRALLGGVSPFFLIIGSSNTVKLNPFLTILLANLVSLVNNVCGYAI
jgi:hypothetical protein